MLELIPNDAESGAKIIVVGVGGAGNNTIDRMINEKVEGVDFYCVNTDRQQLMECLTPNIVQIGENITKGLGAGANPEVGEAAAVESRDTINEIVKDADMVFVTCGMGGGTGTGAAPVVAQISKGNGALTVGVVTKPFRFEAKTRMNNAIKGIEELKQQVDTLIVVPNDRLLEIVDRKTTLPDALKKADQVLQQGIQGITDLINKTGLINLDFADVKTVMQDKGLAHFGIGEGSGANKCIDAAKIAVNSPLLETSIEHATHVIINISGDISLIEASEASDYVQELAGEDSTIIFGVIYDESMVDTAKVTIIATGLEDQREEKSLFINTKMPAVNNTMGRTTSTFRNTVKPTVSAPSQRTGQISSINKTVSNEQAQIDDTMDIPQIKIPEPPKPKKTTSTIKIPDFLRK